MSNLTAFFFVPAKETEFRFNHRKEEGCKLLLKMTGSNLLEYSGLTQKSAALGCLLYSFAINILAEPLLE